MRRVVSILLLGSAGVVSSFHMSPCPPTSSRICRHPTDGTAMFLFKKKGQRKKSEVSEDGTSTATAPRSSKLSRRQLKKLVNHPLYRAGQTFMAASVQSMGMLFYNVGGMEHKEIQSELLAAGTHLVSAAEYWDNDWKTTQTKLADCSKVFADISDTFGCAQIDDAEPLATLFEAVGLELDDMTKIEKRRKTAPNLFAIRDHLTSVAEILQQNSVAETDDHDIFTSFVSASESFGTLGERYS